ncbi:MAG: N-acetyltransferase family protein [Roseobacter sp.]
MIRPASPQDAAAVATLWNDMIRDTLATFTTEEKRIEDIQDLVHHRAGRFFVDELTGVIRGFGTFGRFRSGPGYVATCEHSIVVSPTALRQSIGHRLMSHLQNAAQAQGNRIMVAAISGANPDAVAFHLACGFEKVGHLPEVGCKQGKWLDLILMQKNLSLGR